MAESISFNVAANIITKLGALGLRELGLIRGVQDEVEKLRDTVSTIKAALLAAEDQQQYSKNEEVKNWVSRLKDAFHDVDDLIDEFSYETLRRQVMTKHRKKSKQVRIFFSTSNQVAFGFKMGHKIKGIREKLDAINADRTQFHFSKHTRVTPDEERQERRFTHSYICEEDVIGRDDVKKAIVDNLMYSNAKVDIPVISIVGIGGLGKTTLAQYIYNDEKITKHFELKLWVCISEKFNIKDVVEKIIESATNKKPDPLEMDLLQNKLQGEIAGKKYLLILDDVWNEDYGKWSNLKRLLMRGAKGSKIVITTCSEKVAKAFDTTSLYPLQNLDEDSSWFLFKRMAFKEREGRENPNLINIGKQIVAKIKGNPLVVRMIGRLLYFKNSEADWLTFKNDELHVVLQQENELNSVLKLIYNHLPSNLKQCFTYCALFPKDYEIQKDEVIKQWVAQGFVQPDGSNKPIEDIGHDYFMELSWRSFFQEIRKNKWGDIMGCKMNHFMHHFACSIVENECMLANVVARTIDKRTRHVSLYFDPNQKLQLSESLFEAKNLRTFILRDHHACRSPTDYNKSLLNKILSTFLRLRTLNLNMGGITKLPDSVSELKHLRFLDLSQNSFMELLPNSITKLYNLETLILAGCQRLREFPSDTADLINLRHLDMRGCCNLTHMPKGIGGLTDLQILNLFVLAKDHGSGFSELIGLNNLRGSVTIRGLNFCRIADLQKNANYLNLKPDLQKLELDWNKKNFVENPKSKIDAMDDGESVLECLQPHPNIRKIHICQYQGLRLSNWFSSNSLVNLVTVKLSSCQRLQHLPRFDQFPSLKHLVLQSLTCIEYIDNDDKSLYSSIFFPSLERLSICNMPKLKRWWKGEKSSLPTFPCLSKLEIVDCCELTTIPWHPPLWSLKMDRVCMTLLESMVMKRTGNLIVESSPAMFILYSLCLSRIEDLEFLPQEFFCNLKILEFLLIQDCNNLRMPLSCVDEKGADVPWQNLESLHSLTFDGILKLECLPKGLQHVTTLRFLRLQNCLNLETLPEWIGNFTSLKSLNIHDCPKLTSLPEGIRHLTSLSRLIIYNCCNLASLPEGMIYLHSLQFLTIGNCPKLQERCKEETGEDWVKIAHVPELYFP